MSDACILLLSGGLDSATCLLLARREGLQVHALSFDYGQRHAIELDCARQLAKRYGAESHRVIRLDLAMPSASALTDPSREVPRHALGDTAIPVTYVPARNTLFLAHALAFGEAIGARDLFLGANALDYSGYPDCRPEFLEAFERIYLTSLLRIHAGNVTRASEEAGVPRQTFHRLMAKNGIRGQ